MGSCVGKKKTRPQINEDLASATQTLDGATLVPPVQQRKRLSFWKNLEPGQVLSPEEFAELVKKNVETATSAPTTPKEKLSVMVFGENSVKRQEQYDDKTARFDGTKVTLEQLATAGVAVACKKGKKSESPNQDDYCIIFRKPTLLFGVFDGHGDFGHYISDFVHLRLPTELMSHPKIRKNPKKAMSDAFLSTNRALVKACEAKDCRFNCEYSGTTATMLLIQHEKLIIGHVGDSRAVIGRTNELGDITAVELTHDHKPNNARERNRIVSKHGEVRLMPEDCDFRVFCKGKDVPGLAMSRAIGDTVAQEVGVIAEPDVKEVAIGPDDEFLLMCTDGVWEFLSNQEAVRIVAEQGRNNVKKAAEKVCQVAYNRWVQRCHNLIDDITALVVYLPKPGVLSYADFACEWSSDSEVSEDSH